MTAATPLAGLRVRLRADTNTARAGAEGLWAEPVRAHAGGGTYRLATSGLFVPLRTGDLVRAELDSSSRLQVVGIEGLHRGPVSTVTYPDTIDPEVLGAMASEWSQHGAEHTEGAMGYLVTTWLTGTDAETVALVLSTSLPGGWNIDSIVGPLERTSAIENRVHLGLEAPADYRAREDPAWRAIGVTDPGALDYLQALAAADPRVLATIRAGRHADVATYASRLTSPAEALRPLTHPLLVETPTD